MSKPSSHEILERLEAIDRRLQILEAFVRHQGIDFPWMSPKDAAAFVGQSPEMIRVLIREADEARQHNRKHHLKRGIHYRSKGNPSVKRQRWEINVELWNKRKDPIAS